MNDSRRSLGYALTDLVLTVAAWQAFSTVRFYVTHDTCGFSTLESFLNHPKAWLMGIGMPLFIVLANAFLGHYAAPRRKTHAVDFLQVLSGSFLCSLIIFFTVVINDYPAHYTQFYTVFSVLFAALFFFQLLGRRLLTGRLLRAHARGQAGVPALIIGRGRESDKIREYLAHRNNGSPFLTRAVVAEDDLSDLAAVIREQGIESLIIASDDLSEEHLRVLAGQLYPFGLEILSTTSTEGLAYSDMALFSLTGVPLRRITPKGLTRGEENIKRLADVLVSSLGLVVLSPLLLVLSLRLKLAADGPVFYQQERLGKGGRPFQIYKFRTMRVDAESQGPCLSSSEDERITKIGRTLRRYRLDELPQLWNVLKGDMSLVGPRPERAFYAAQIVARDAQYRLVDRVRPGITSLGMVRFGYADNVDKMVDRFHYDLIYLRNQSLLMDLKILVYTLKPLLTGKGV